MRPRDLVLAAIAGAALPVFRAAESVDASAPNQTVAHWNYSGQCVDSPRWTFDTESLVKQTLPNEWGLDSTWPPDSLDAGASIIRQDSWFKHNHPESAFGLNFCKGVSSYQFDWRDSYMAFIQGSNNPRTDDATNATQLKGWSSSTISANNLELGFGSCLQFNTRTQAQNGYGWRSIVGSSSYPPGEYASGNPCGSPVLAPLNSTILY